MSNIEPTPFLYSRQTGEIFTEYETGKWIVLGCLECDMAYELPPDTEQLVIVDV